MPLATGFLEVPRKGLLTVGSEVDQQQAQVLDHLRVVLVQLVRVLDEAEAATVLQHYRPQRRQLWAEGRQATVSLLRPLGRGDGGTRFSG